MISPSSIARIRYPISGTLDTTGKGNLISPQFTLWSSVNVACQTQKSVNTNWTIYTAATNQPSLSNTVDFGVGGSFRGGPYLVAPNEYVIIEATNANPNDTVLGAISGLSGISLDQLLNVGPAGGGNSVVGTISAEVANTVSVAGTVGTTDAGLAGSIASALSVMVPYGTYPLTSGGLTSIQVGANGAQGPFPSQVGSWMLQIYGLGYTGYGVRLLWQGYDASGVTPLYQRERHSSQQIYDNIVATGDVDAPMITWNIYLPSGAPTTCTARLYFSADKVPDQWYDSAIYYPFLSTQNQSLGLDGVLLSVDANLAANTSATYSLPTYRGMAQFGIYATNTGHAALLEYDYQGNLIRSYKNLPINNTSGVAVNYYQFKLMGVNNQIKLINSSSSAGNQMYGQIDAINDLI